jgi:hypothetical protein
MRTAKITLYNIKESDGWFQLCSTLFPNEEGENEKCYEMFKYGEYGTLEIIVDENFNIIGGKIIKNGKKI